MSASEPSSPPRRLVSGIAFALAAVVLMVLSLLAQPAAPQPNGLGLLPQTVTLMQRSGVLLSDPTQAATVTRSQAVAVAVRQGHQDTIQRAFLAQVTSTGGGPLGNRSRLCWVVLLQANPDAFGNLPAPGQIELYMVLVDAHSGRFLEGVIAFNGQPETGVGTE